jgi:site-specific DNA-cytosine methylase
MKHATIIPLIGGLTIGQDAAFGEKSSHLLTYEAFAANDSHLVNWYKEDNVPYHVIDRDGPWKGEKAIVVGSVCPCAGLSQLSSAHGTDNPKNDWLIKASNYMFEEYRPQVFWGENAPGFAGKIGKDIRERMYAAGRKAGYTMSVYRTKSLLHGSPQVRERSFFFFWKGDKVPLLNYYNKPRVRIEDVIRGTKGNFQTEVINKANPTDNPYYAFILKVIHGGIDHKTFARDHMFIRGSGNLDVQSYIESQGYTYDVVAKWMGENGYEREVAKCLYKFEKLKTGKNIMRRSVMVPNDYIGAFVSHYPHMLTHPDEERFITYREAMTIMGLPDNFELLKPRASVNHICQNVPVQTATDMAVEIREALAGNREWIDASLVFQYNHSQKHEIHDEKAATVDGFLVDV